MKYTSLKKADEKVQQNLNAIKNILIKKLNPISIILFGGFGRGEGSFEIIKKKIVPLNDYDLYIVTKEKISDKILDEVGRECSKAIGRGGLEFVETPNKIYDKNKFFHVDLRCLTISELGKLKKINRTYELKHASAVIYGKDLRNRIKDFSLPVSEAFRYLMNPACQLLVCMDSRRLKKKFKGNEEFLAAHYINKAYLSCASALLISAGKFSPTYARTNQAFQKIYGKNFPELARKINEATRLKLMPFNKRNRGGIIKEWFEAIDDLTFTLSYLADKHLGIKETDIKELIKKIYRKLPYRYFEPYLPFGFLSKIAFPAQYMLNVLYFIRTRYIRVLLGWRDVGIKIALSAFLLLHALDDKMLLKESAKYIKTFSHVSSESWEDLRAVLLYAFDKYFSQKLI